MGNKDKHIRSEVRKTLEMADRIRKVEGNPFLATRVLQQIENERSRNTGWFFTRIPAAYKMAFSVLLIALNLMVFIQSGALKQQSGQSGASFDIGSEYGLVVEDTYELSYTYVSEQ